MFFSQRSVAPYWVSCTLLLSGCLDVGRPVQLRPDAEIVDLGRPDDGPALDATPDVDMHRVPDAQPSLDVGIDATVVDAAVDVDGYLPQPYVETMPHAETVVCQDNAAAPPCNGCPAGTEVPVGWVCVPAGRYVIGSSPGEQSNADDSQAQTVFQPLPFLIQSQEFSQADWRYALPGAAEPSFGRESETCQDEQCPAERVSLYEAIRAADAWTFRELGTGRGDRLCYPQLEVEDGSAIGTGCGDETVCEPAPGENGWRVTYNPACGCDTYRLPTDIEWEIAARAGTRGSRWHDGSGQSLNQVGWSAASSEAHVHEGGQLLPNGFGLYDVLGNVAEWAMNVIPREDQWSFPNNNSAIRGGSYLDDSDEVDSRVPPTLRSASRTMVLNLRRDAAIGFRLVRTLYPPGTHHCLCKSTCSPAEDCRNGLCVSTVGDACDAHYQCGNDGRCIDGQCQLGP